MDFEEDSGDPFAIPDLWKPSQLVQLGRDGPTPLYTLLPLDGPGGFLEEVALPKLPEITACDLDSFSWGPTENLGPFSESTGSSDEEGNVADDEPEDIWTASGPTCEDLVTQPYSWEAYSDATAVEPRSAYISEAGPKAFDALSALQADGEESTPPVRLVRTTSLLSSLRELGAGRDSVLFRYNDRERRFLSLLGGLRISGFSFTAIQSLCGDLLECGRRARVLQEEIDRTYASSNATPARVALAEATSTVLSALQATLSLSRPAGTTVLELQRLFHQPSMVVSCFENLSKAAKLAQDDEHLLSALYENVLRLEHNTGWFRDILLEVLARVSAPWLESLAVWIGIRREAYAPEGRRNATGFVHVERRTWVDDRGVEMSEAEYDLDLSMVPTFIAHEDARLMFETGKSLRLLKAHHPDHPLAQPERASNAQAPSLDWGYSWKHVEQVEAKARRYEERLIAAVNMYARTGRAMEVQSPGDEQASSSAAAAAPSAGEDMQTRMAASAVAMASPLEHLLAPTADPLRNLILDACVPDSEALPSNSSTFAPPLSLTAPLSFSPIVSAQARLVNSACIRLLFKEHNVRSHLSIQRRFHLFGDGTFTSRLSHALFDPDMESAERQKGVARSGAAMGLKLGSRESWPPASSELRLTLTGLLAETYQPDAAGDTHGSNRLPRGGEMPGGLSFSVREMSDEEIDKCMNPDSIEALDFLRLQYKPPAPLDSIITPACLLKYDKLFKLLLRVVRMNYVVNQLFRDATDRTSSWHGIDPVAQKFRIEAHHFVSTIGGYLFEVGVGSTWRKFEDKLDEVERRIDEEDARGIIGLTEGVGRLREYHERVLDRMLFATLLRKRQEQVMKLLEDTFSVILAFARYSRGRASGTASERPDDAAELRLMHTRFRKRVAVLVSVCRGLSEKRGYGQRRRARGEAGHFGEDELSEEGGNTIAQLLLKLEMSPYYSTQM